MGITRLDIACLRNLDNVSLQTIPELNVICGPNGAGKTSILEAIHLLGNGRSFRTHKIGTVIAYDCEALTLFGRIQHEDMQHAIGIRKGRDKSVSYRLDGDSIRSQSQISRLIPTKAITTALHALLEDAPEERRGFLDWGLFHVKQDYGSLFQHFKRVLGQRNALLRAESLHNLGYWDRAFIEAATQIHTLRLEYLEQLKGYIQASVERLLPAMEFSLRYRQGWQREMDLATALDVSRETDCRRGFTSVGPQRADIQFLVNGHNAVDFLSRGQEKVFIIGLHMAQVLHLYEQHGVSSVMLIDDIASEVDPDSLYRVLKNLQRCATQIFMTVIDEAAIDTRQWQRKKLFHVEHGRVQEVV